jgi:DNA-binding response OmpR family regulator
LRRGAPATQNERLRVGALEIDVEGRVARHRGQTLELTSLEFDLLVTLAQRAGRVVTRDALLSRAGRDDVSVGERAVDVHISHLRQKLGDDSRAPRLIRTIRGAGYMLTKEEQ